MSTKKQREPKSARVAEITDQLQGLKLLGEIITWNARAESAHKHSDVVTALTNAGLDDKLARTLLPRHAFARASKKLAGDGLIHILREEVDCIVFQFTEKFMDQNEWKFQKKTFLELNKITGEIKCQVTELQQIAQQQLDRCLEERTTSDITRIVQTLFDKEADLFPIRDQGGAYFVPNECTPFIAKIETFLHALGGKVTRFPVPKGTQYGDRSVQDTVTGALDNMIDEHTDAVRSFTLNTRSDTIEHAAEKIKATRVKIEAYSNYLGDKQKSLLASIDKANEELLAQVNKLADLRENAPESNNGNGHSLFGHSPTAVMRWMGKAGWKYDQAKKALDKLSIGASDNTIKTQLQWGKSGRKEAAELTPNQIMDLIVAAE